LNGADGKAAQMFTLAHELAHVWFGSSAAFDLRGMQPASDRTEIACDRVAAEFLVPTSELRQLWPMISNISDRFQRAARQFKVSDIVAARRALDLELITKRQFFNFYEEYRAADRPAKGQSGGDFYLTQNRRLGLRFAEAVVHAVLESKLLYREAYRLTGLYGSTFQRYAESIMAGETL
jgi:Zn-dependent peptidase ImmA (M78 family)